jgi:hypothetical protein
MEDKTMITDARASDFLALGCNVRFIFGGVMYEIYE